MHGAGNLSFFSSVRHHGGAPHILSHKLGQHACTRRRLSVDLLVLCQNKKCDKRGLPHPHMTLFLTHHAAELVHHHHHHHHPSIEAFETRTKNSTHSGMYQTAPFY